MRYYVRCNELYHHGILGMRWGKRNGPPYPLGVSDHSASEKKAGWRKSLDGGSNSPSKTSKRKGLSDKQKTAIKIGAGVAVAAIAAYAGYKLYQSGRLDPVIKKGKELLNNGETGLDKFKDTSGEYLNRSPTEESSLINPKYGKDGYTMNCSNCSLAYEMRRRGYKVQAKSLKGIGRFDSQVRKAFTDIPKDAIKSVDDLQITTKSQSLYEFEKEHLELSAPERYKLYDQNIMRRGEEVMTSLKKEISAFPPGSRGIFSIKNKRGGHVMAWEIEKDGTVDILNPQHQSLMEDGNGNGFTQWLAGYQTKSELLAGSKIRGKLFADQMSTQIIRTDQLTISDYGRSWLTTESGENLPTTTSQIIKTVAKDASAVAAGKIIFDKAMKKSKKEKKK